MFNIQDATSTDAINQLIESYNNSWNGKYKLTSLLNLWYYTVTVDKTVVYCRGYYIYNNYNYWNSYFSYDTITGLYNYFNESGNEATKSDNGLSPMQLKELTLYYTNFNPYIVPDDNLESSLSNINLDFSNIKIKESYKIPLSGIWNYIKISGDALYQIAAQSSDNGQIFISSNYGLNWKHVQYLTDNNYIGNFADVAISKDGKYMTVLQVNGPIAISSNYGEKWRIIRNCVSKIGNENVIFNLEQSWYSIDMSGDGQYQTALSVNYISQKGGYIYRSDSYGTSWIDITPITENPPNFTSVSISYSGKYQTIVNLGYLSYVQDPSSVLISQDYGNTWTISDYFKNDYDLLHSIINKSQDANIDGKYQYITHMGNKLYISSDYGQTWELIYITEEYYYNINSITSSSDGKILYSFITNRINNFIYTSNDYGKSWFITYKFNNFLSQFYFTIDTSDNGSFITSTNYTDKIIFSNNYGKTFTDYNNSQKYTNLYPVQCSSSGQYQLSFISNDSIIVSNNNGITWNKINIIDNWASCTISLTGQYQAVINNNGLLYISYDYGKTWDYNIQLIKSNIVKVSGDGSYYVVLSNENIQTSTDYGKTFRSEIYKYYTPEIIIMSLNGKYQTILQGGSIISSNDKGKSFENVNIMYNWATVDISMSSNGKFQLYVDTGHYYYISDDFGKTCVGYPQVRNDIVSVGNCCVSSTGQYQFMSLKTNTNYYIYYSKDYGNTWNILDTSSINYSSGISSVSSTGQSIILSNQNSIYQIYLDRL